MLLFSFVSSILGLIFSLFQLYEGGPPFEPPYSSDVYPSAVPNRWVSASSQQNPPPPHFATAKNIAPSQQVYIAVIDTAYSPQRYHCLMKEQWIDALLQFDYIDGIEFYSISPFHNPDCNFSPLSIPPLNFNIPNPSSHVLYHALKLFLSRSSAEYLFLINDAAYVNVPKLDDYLRSALSTGRRGRWAIGGCIERRFYFQMLTITSGILLSRHTAEEVVSRDSMWNVTIETGLPSEESFSQILDDVGVTPRFSRRDEFLGQPFRNPAFNEQMLTKEFKNLRTCVRPSDNPGDSGVATVCSTAIVPWGDIIIWAGGGRTAAGKEAFLRNAKAMLEGNPADLHFTWDRLFPELCTRSRE
jgi:hypothetical protein